jgi:hypothetical protein
VTVAHVSDVKVKFWDPAWAQGSDAKQKGAAAVQDEPMPAAEAAANVDASADGDDDDGNDDTGYEFEFARDLEDLDIAQGGNNPQTSRTHG